MASDGFQWFDGCVEGTFHSRPNRFVAWVDYRGQRFRLHCPNPGRMTELLRPGVGVLFRLNSPSSQTAAFGGSTQGSLEAILHPTPGGQARVVPIHSARANQAARVLALPLLFPGFQAIHGEYTLGKSRFDFLVVDALGRKQLVEVKYCSECEHGSALFPDAPSTRASRHLEELSLLAAAGYGAHVLFLLGHGTCRILAPNVHTDPLFGRTMARVAGKVEFHALQLRAERDGRVWRLAPPGCWLPVGMPVIGDPALVWLVYRNPAGGWLMLETRVKAAQAENLKPGRQPGWLSGPAWLVQAPDRPPALKVFPVLGPRMPAWDPNQAQAAICGPRCLDQGPGWWLFEWEADPREHPCWQDRLMLLRHRMEFMDLGPRVQAPGE